MTHIAPRPIILAAALLCALVPVPAAALSLPDWLNFSQAEAQPVPIRPVASEIIEEGGAALRWVPGVIASRNQVNMAFQTLGRMTRRNVDLGDRVREGDLLAELATEDLEATVRAAQAAVGSAEVEARTARATLERTQALADRNVASAAQLEEAMRASTAADAQERQAQSELAQAEDSLEHARMIAPFDGVISGVFEAPGAVVSQGAPVLQLSAEDQREAMIDLPEAMLDGVPPRATFTVWQGDEPETGVPAVVDRIEPLADAATRTRRLYLTLPETSHFRLGALVRARLGHADAPALSVPTVALFDRDGRPHVWRVMRQPDGAAQVQAVAVEAGPDLMGRVLISSGLSVGDEVVIRGVHSLTDGQAVGRRVQP